MSKIALVVKFKAAEGRKQALIEGLKGHAQRSLDNEDGCVRFDVLIPRGGDADVMLYELYENQASFDLHSASDHIKMWREMSQDLVAERNITITEVQN
jgi:(4S)-4-hydroxy-5-phosphonooxypentane-2,3-dione isomerase